MHIYSFFDAYRQAQIHTQLLLCVRQHFFMMTWGSSSEKVHVCVVLKIDMSFSPVILSLPPSFSPSPPPVLTDMSKLSWTCQSRAEYNRIAPHSP